MRYSWLIILLSLSTVTVEADEQDPEAMWVKGQALFYDFRDLESLSHRERIRILEQAEECIQQAHDRQAFRQCEQTEQAARQQLRAELRERRDALLNRL